VFIFEKLISKVYVNKNFYYLGEHIAWFSWIGAVAATLSRCIGGGG
jgi:hypothetical protein